MTIFTVSGWAQPYDALTNIYPNAVNIDYHNCKNIEQIMELFAATIPKNAAVAGWSMGGTLLMQAISQNIIAPNKLILIATPAQFVTCPEFEHGMDKVTFDLFYRSYSVDPARTIKRFSGLIAKGDSKNKMLLQSMPYCKTADDSSFWQGWLDMLESHRHNEYVFEDFPPTLLIHGKQDAIVKYQQSQWLSANIPHSELYTLDEAGHAPHRHCPKRTQAVVAKFLE